MAELNTAPRSLFCPSSAREAARVKSPASRRGWDKRGFHRKARNSMCFVNYYYHYYYHNNNNNKYYYFRRPRGRAPGPHPARIPGAGPPQRGTVNVCVYIYIYNGNNNNNDNHDNDNKHHNNDDNDNNINNINNDNNDNNDSLR